MKKLQKFIASITLPMVFLLPFWLTLGRAFLGAGGWATLYMLFFVGPILLALLLFFYFMIRLRPDVMNTRLFGRVDSILLLIFYVSVFLFGFFLVDGGDTTESIHSTAQLFGLATIDMSDVMASIFYTISVVTALMLVVIVTAERIKKDELWVSRKAVTKINK